MNSSYVLGIKDLLSWLDSLGDEFNLFGPVLKKRGQVVFEKLEEVKDLYLDYHSTMVSPRKFIYPPEQDLFLINRDNYQFHTIMPPGERSSIILGMHPCDMHALTVLDRTFSGDFKDFYYHKLRERTLTIVLNCNKACDNGFCSSMGTGPFLKIKKGYDIELTALMENYLLEFGSERGENLVERAKNLKKATRKDFKEKLSLEKKAGASFFKWIDIKDLPALLMRNLDHSVYKETAEARCLGCANCTMVCPTCYCYNIEDYTSFDLKTTLRKRQWDSCQELNFAKVHGGNFRSSREARLRQFVTHKLSTWVEQYGCFGCVGCGRCITWCPTGIDLTEIAKEIQEDYQRGKAR